MTGAREEDVLIPRICNTQDAHTQIGVPNRKDDAERGGDISVHTRVDISVNHVTMVQISPTELPPAMRWRNPSSGRTCPRRTRGGAAGRPPRT